MVELFGLFVHSLLSKDCEWYISLKMCESDKDKDWFSGKVLGWRMGLIRGGQEW